MTKSFLSLDLNEKKDTKYKVGKKVLLKDSGKYVEIKACCENDVYEVLVEGAPPEHELEELKS